MTIVVSSASSSASSPTLNLAQAEAMGANEPRTVRFVPRAAHQAHRDPLSATLHGGALAIHLLVAGTLR
jgi:hypothetical protein